MEFDFKEEFHEDYWGRVLRDSQDVSAQMPRSRALIVGFIRVSSSRVE